MLRNTLPNLDFIFFIRYLCVCFLIDLIEKKRTRIIILKMFTLLKPRPRTTYLSSNNLRDPSVSRQNPFLLPVRSFPLSCLFRNFSLSYNVLTLTPLHITTPLKMISHNTLPDVYIHPGPPLFSDTVPQVINNSTVTTS